MQTKVHRIARRKEKKLLERKTERMESEVKLLKKKEIQIRNMRDSEYKNKKE